MKEEIKGGNGTRLQDTPFPLLCSSSMAHDWIYTWS